MLFLKGAPSTGVWLSRCLFAPANITQRRAPSSRPPARRLSISQNHAGGCDGGGGGCGGVRELAVISLAVPDYGFGGSLALNFLSIHSLLQPTRLVEQPSFIIIIIIIMIATC